MKQKDMDIRSENAPIIEGESEFRDRSLWIFHHPGFEVGVGDGQKITDDTILWITFL